jgi:hypothetical protein
MHGPNHAPAWSAARHSLEFSEPIQFPKAKVTAYSGLASRGRYLAAILPDSAECCARQTEPI